MSIETFWIIVGFMGQALFSMRFIIQWAASERARRSIIPHAFWFFSIGGGATLLAYALYKEDPVFIAGQATGLVIYFRNIYLIFRERRAADAKAKLERHENDDRLTIGQMMKS